MTERLIEGNIVHFFTSRYYAVICAKKIMAYRLAIEKEEQ